MITLTYMQALAGVFIPAWIGVAVCLLVVALCKAAGGDDDA